MRIITEELTATGTLAAYIQDSSDEMATASVRPAMLVLPGGGYLYCSDREAEPVALAYLAQGFNCFVLRYATGEHPWSESSPTESRRWSGSATTPRRWTSTQPRWRWPDSPRAGTWLRAWGWPRHGVRTPIPFESHIYLLGPHGLSLSNAALANGNAAMVDAAVAQWLHDSVRFLLSVFGDFAIEGEAENYATLATRRTPAVDMPFGRLLADEDAVAALERHLSTDVVDSLRQDPGARDISLRVLARRDTDRVPPPTLRLSTPSGTESATVGSPCSEADVVDHSRVYCYRLLNPSNRAACVRVTVR